MMILSRGDEVAIYEDPLSRAKPEGMAEIRSIEKIDLFGGQVLVYAEVLFTGDVDPVIRSILVDGIAE